MTDIELTALKAEIQNDPMGLGYPAGDNPAIAVLLNAVGTETVDRGVVNGQEMQMCVVISEYIALSAVARDGWMALISAGDGQVNPADPRVVAQVQAIWAAGTETRDNLQDLQTRLCSRAETLFGAGVSIGHSDVANALLYH